MSEDVINSQVDSVETLRAVIADLETENKEQAEQIAVLQARIAASHVGEGLVKVRFVRPEKTVGQTIMQYQVLLESGPLRGVAIVGQVTRDAKGTEQARKPSAYGTDFVAAVSHLETLANGRVWPVPDVDGVVIMDGWTTKIYAAYLAFKTTGKADQVVSFRQ